MIRIRPGTKYYWQDYDTEDGWARGEMDAPGRHDALRTWVQANVPPYRCSIIGDQVDEITFIFHDEADALAFRIKFGI